MPFRTSELKKVFQDVFPFLSFSFFQDHRHCGLIFFFYLSFYLYSLQLFHCWFFLTVFYDLLFGVFDFPIFSCWGSGFVFCLSGFIASRSKAKVRFEKYFPPQIPFFPSSSDRHGESSGGKIEWKKMNKENGHDCYSTWSHGRYLELLHYPILKACRELDDFIIPVTPSAGLSSSETPKRSSIRLGVRLIYFWVRGANAISWRLSVNVPMTKYSQNASFLKPGSNKSRLRSMSYVKLVEFLCVRLASPPRNIHRKRERNKKAKKDVESNAKLNRKSGLDSGACGGHEARPSRLGCRSRRGPDD